MNVILPYGQEKVEFVVADHMFIGMLDPAPILSVPDPAAEIARAIDEPIGAPPLADIVSGRKSVAIIVDDGSRPTPVSLILPILISKLEAAGIRASDIRIVAALGSHRYMTPAELADRVGSRIYARYPVINSEFRDPAGLVDVGLTADGVRILAAKCVMDADIRIGVGNLAPHPVMGWGGGGKILYPGVAGEQTVAYFHLKAALIDDNLFGRDATPIREMMEAWVDSIGLDFIINTVMTPDLRLAKAVAGHYIAAHRAGVEAGKLILGRRVLEKADVIVAGSHPADQDFWQSPKAMYAAEPALQGRQGGTIILVSPNYEGIGPHAEYPACMGRDDGDSLVQACIRGEPVSGDPLAIAVGNSMSKLRRRRKLVVVSDGVASEQMAACGCLHYPRAKLQQAVDDAAAGYAHCRIAALSNGADTFLYE